MFYIYKNKHTASAIAWVFAYTIDTSWSTGRTIAVSITFGSAFNKWISEIVLNQIEMVRVMWLTDPFSREKGKKSANSSRSNVIFKKKMYEIDPFVYIKDLYCSLYLWAFANRTMIRNSTIGTNTAFIAGWLTFKIFTQMLSATIIIRITSRNDIKIKEFKSFNWDQN